MAPKAMVKNKTPQVRNDPQGISASILGRLSIRGLHNFMIPRVTEYNQLVCGIINLLKFFRRSPLAQNLKFIDIADHDTARKRDQCEKILMALRQVNCPFTPQLNSFMTLDYTSMGASMLWVLHETLILESRVDAIKSSFMEYFDVNYDDKDEALSGFEKKYHESIVEMNRDKATFKLFHEQIFGKQLNGMEILDMYVRNNMDSDSSENQQEGLENLSEKDIKENEEYINSLAKSVEEGSIEECDKIEKFIFEQASIFYSVKQEAIRLISLFTRFSNSFVPFDENIAAKMLEHQDHLMDQVKEFKKKIHTEYDSTCLDLWKLQTGKDGFGQNLEKTSEQALQNKLEFYKQKFENMIRASRDLKKRLKDQYIKSLSKVQSDARVELMTFGPDVESSNFYTAADFGMGEKCAKMNMEIATVLENSKKMPGNPSKKAIKYQSAFFSYLENVLLKITDLYWKIELMNYCKARVYNTAESNRAMLKGKMREQVKSIHLTDLIHEMNINCNYVKSRFNALVKEVEDIEKDMAVTNSQLEKNSSNKNKK